MKAKEKHSENPQATAAAGSGEKIPAFEQGEDRLAPVAEKPERIDGGKAGNEDYGNNGMSPINPAAPIAPKAPENSGEAGAADAAGRSAIGAIAAAMAIDTRLAHVLLDIHAGMDGAEAVARAYGVALPGKAAKADDGSYGNHGDNVNGGGDEQCGVPPVPRLPEGVVSVPSFLNTQRRSFWE